MLDAELNVPIFRYTSSNFHFHLDDNDEDSEFDTAVKESWVRVHKNGLFRYSVDIKEWKFLKGKYNFLAQLHIERACNRRMPQHILSVKQSVDVNSFNFNKICSEEILFGTGDIDDDSLLVINVSPIEKYHCLFLPQRSQYLPQCITEFSLHRSIELLLLSKSPYFRVAFNGLCALASVNHLHWHIYYLKHRMLLEYINVCRYVGPLFLLSEFPSKGFCLKLSYHHDLKDLVYWVFLITNYLQEHEIAHNVFITRAMTTPSEKGHDDIRIYIWARNPYKGAKDTVALVPGVCELFGHLSIRNKDSYENITEESASQILTKETEEVFQTVKHELKNLIEKQRP